MNCNNFLCIVSSTFFDDTATLDAHFDGNLLTADNQRNGNSTINSISSR